MTFRPYARKVRLGTSEVFLSISDFSQLPDGYVLSRVGTEIVATLIGQDRLALDEPQRPTDAATKSYTDAVITADDRDGYFGYVQVGQDSAYFVDHSGTSHYMLNDGLVVLSGTNVVLDADPALPVYRTINLQGLTTFTTDNLASGRAISLRLVAGGSSRGLSFPDSWKWLGGSAPVSIPANKVAMVSVVAYGSTDSDVMAGWSYTDTAVITGQGQAGQVAFFDNDRNIAGDAGFTWDTASNSLVVGSVESPAASLHVADTVQVDGYALFGSDVSVGGNKVTNVASPVDDGDAANKQYVEGRRLLAIQTLSSSNSINPEKDLVFITGSGGSVVRLPEASAGNAGKVIVIKKKNSGGTDFIGTALGSGQSIDGTQMDSTSQYLNLYLYNESVSVVSDGSDWYII